MKSFLKAQGRCSSVYFKMTYLSILCQAISGCNSLRTLELQKVLTMDHQDFYIVLEFESRTDLPLVHSTIIGHSDWLLFDTGAPNVLDRDFAERLQLSQLGLI